MPRFLRFFNTMIHVPSLSSVSIDTDCFGRPYLLLTYHVQKDIHISFPNWAECEAAMTKVKGAMTEVEAALASIPLVEQAPPPALAPPAPAPPLDNGQRPDGDE
jgi:hypothetical protein